LDVTFNVFQREGGIAVKNNEDVWGEILIITDKILYNVVHAITEWSKVRIDSLHKCLQSVQQATDIFISKEKWKSEDDMYVAFSLVVGVIKEAIEQLQFWCDCLPPMVVSFNN